MEEGSISDEDASTFVQGVYGARSLSDLSKFVGWPVFISALLIGTWCLYWVWRHGENPQPVSESSSLLGGPKTSGAYKRMDNAILASSAIRSDDVHAEDVVMEPATPSHRHRAPISHSEAIEL